MLTKPCIIVKLNTPFNTTVATDGIATNTVAKQILQNRIAEKQKAKDDKDGKEKEKDKRKVAFKPIPPVTEFHYEIDRERSNVMIAPFLGSVGKTFHFDHLYSPQEPLSQIYPDSIDPLIANFMTGYNISMFFIGLSQSGKSTLIHGTGVNEYQIGVGDGIIGLIGENIFKRIALSNKANTNMRNYSERNTAVTFYAYELIDHIARDLIDPDQRELGIDDDGIRGMMVQNCTVVPITGPDVLNQQFYLANKGRSLGNRQSCMQVYCVEVTWSEFEIVNQGNANADVVMGGGGELVLKNSRSATLKLIDTGGAEWVFAEALQSGFGEGYQTTNMNPNLDFYKTLKTLANTPRHEPIPTISANPLSPSSPFQKLLQDDVCGQNVLPVLFVSVVVGIRQNQSFANIVELLDLSEAFSDRLVAVKIGEEDLLRILRGMRAKMYAYRSQIMHDIESAKAQLAMHLDNQDPNAFAMVLAGANRLVMELRDQNAKLSQRMKAVTLRAKEYENKIEELEKLLLETQLSSQESLGKTHSELLDSHQRLVSVETELLTKTLQIQSLTSTLMDSSQVVEEYKIESKDLKMELEVVMGNYSGVVSEVEKLVARNEELGMEMIYLIRVKESLGKRVEALTREVDALSRRNFELTEHIQNTVYGSGNSNLQGLQNVSQSQPGLLLLKDQEIAALKTQLTQLRDTLMTRDVSSQQNEQQQSVSRPGSLVEYEKERAKLLSRAIVAEKQVEVLRGLLGKAEREKMVLKGLVKAHGGRVAVEDGDEVDEEGDVPLEA